MRPRHLSVTEMRAGLSQLRLQWRHHDPFTPLNPSALLIDRDGGTGTITLGEFAVRSLHNNR